MAGRQVRRPELTLAVIDHNIATDRDEEIPELAIADRYAAPQLCGFWR